MYFVVLFCLFGIIFAQNSDDYGFDIERERYESECENDDSEISVVVAKCYDKINIQKYSNIIRECFKGIDGEVTGKKMRVWYCVNTNKKTSQADACAANKIAKQEGNEVAFAHLMNDLMKCIKENFPEERR